MNFPIYSPKYLARRQGGAFLQPRNTLRQMCLTDPGTRGTIGTDRHFVITPSLRFNYYTKALLAARSGQGVALRWEFWSKPYLMTERS